MSQFYMNGPSGGNAMSAEEFVSGAAGRSFARAAGRLPDQSFVQGANDGHGANQCPVCCQPCQPCQPAQPPVNGCVCGCNCGNVPSPTPPAGCDCCGTMPSPTPPAGCDCCCNMPNPMPPMCPDCGGTTPDCPDDGCGQNPVYCQQMVCCCHPVSAPAPQPPQVNEVCCCKQSFRAALGLLCDQQISSLLNFDTAAFLTDTYAAGATITPITPPAAGAPVPPDDNLGAALTGSFRRFAACGCDLLDVDAAISTAAGTAVGLTATQVSLCQLAAVAIQIAAGTAEGDLTADEVTARNFRCVRQRLAQKLNSNCGCGQEQCSCSCGCGGEDCCCYCCCEAGLLKALSQNNLSRRVSLVAGVLALQNVTLVGTVGTVLVLANDTDNRLYFVCVNNVQFIA